jgi:TolB-like protein
VSGPDELHDQSTMPAGDAPAQTGPRERPPGFAAGAVLAKRYRIVRFIARGGMGEVYEAEDQELGERVALKTIHPDRVGDQRAVDRFKREIFLARRVTHRNVCRLFDVGFHDTTTFLTMELLEGDTLAQRISKSGRFSAADALPIVQQMAAALDAAHAAGIVHRDFKSQNVMLCGARVVVTDFGLARGPHGGDDAHLSRSGEIVGSPGYMSPEQVEGREVGPAADVYALGVVLFEMMTGRLPFVADTPLATAIKRLKQPPPSPRESASELDAVWETTILRCLSIVPQERFTTAGAVARALSAPRAPRIAITQTMAQQVQRKRWLLVAIPVLLALAGLGGYVFWPRPKPVVAATPARRAVAVVGFRNTTGRADTAWLGSALAEMLSTELGAAETLRTVPAERIARVKLELGLGETDTLAAETLARIRKNTGADLVVVGSYVALGSGSTRRVRVDLHLQDAVAGQTLASWSETGQEETLVDLVLRAGSELRRRMGVSDLAPAAAHVRATLQQLADRAAAASHVGR